MGACAVEPMTRGFMVFFLAVALVIFAAVDFDALGGNSLLGWIWQDFWAICRSMGRFQHF